MPSPSFTQGQPHDRIDDAALGLQVVSLDKRDDVQEGFEITVTQRMLSATLGSLLTSLLVTPLDVVRVRLQSQASNSSITSSIRSVPTSPSPLNPSSRFSSIANAGVTNCCREVFWANNVAPVCYAAPSSGAVGSLQVPFHVTNTSAVNCAVEETQRKSFNSTWDGLQKIARNEGFLSLWRGLSPTLLMAIPGNVIYFSAYDVMRYGERSPIRQHIPDTYSPLVAGSVARVAAAIVVSPIEMFRTRMQAATGGSKGIIGQTMSGMKDLVSAQGYTSLWRGLTLTMWRDVPFSAMYWWGYETVRNQLTSARDIGRGRSQNVPPTARSRSRSRERESHGATLVDSFVAGSISGAVASIATMPFDVGKTRQQVSIHSSDRSGAKAAAELLPEERSMPRFLMHIFRQEGFSGLFRGWIPRTMKTAPACAVMISSYEVSKRYYRDYNKKNSLG